MLSLRSENSLLAAAPRGAHRSVVQWMLGLTLGLALGSPAAAQSRADTERVLPASLNLRTDAPARESSRPASLNLRTHARALESSRPEPLESDLVPG